MNTINVIGHRGAAGLEVENSFASFQKALDIGVDYIENDIWQLQDGMYVVFHDHLLHRVTNGYGKIDEVTYKQLQKTSLNNGEKIPTLDEYLLRAKKNKIKTIFELKNNCDGLTIAEKIKNTFQPREYIIRSFFHDKVHTIKNTFPYMQTGLLFEGSFDPLDIYLSTSNVEYIGLGFDSVDQKTVDVIKKLGKKVLFRTIDDEITLNEAITYQPWGIVSNRPDLIKKILKNN